MRTFIIAVIGFIAALGAPVKAADYAVQKTFWSWVGGQTNLNTTATNLAAAIDVTQFTDFALQVSCVFTNTDLSGGIDIRWDTSIDNVNYSGQVVSPGSSGWFRIPVPATNVANRVTWTTNITVGAVGYWRLAWLTNQAGQAITNLSIVGRVKPKRTNADF